jgi:hypothetical protein
MTSRDILHVLERLFRRYPLHNKRPFDDGLRAEAYIYGVWIELSACDDGTIWACQFGESGVHYAETPYAAVQAAKDAHVDLMSRKSLLWSWQRRFLYDLRSITLDNPNAM